MKYLFLLYLLFFTSQLHAQDAVLLADAPVHMSGSQEDNPRNVGTQKQLFIDDGIIESIEGGVFQELNRPVKSPYNPLIEIDRPYEASMRFSHSSNVIYDVEEDHFKMWNEVGTYDGSDHLLAYYESSDGLRWEKPKVGQFDYHTPHMPGEPTREHNFIFRKPIATMGYGVIKDLNPKGDLGKKYKMLYRLRGPDQSGIWAAYSPDGIRWTDYREVNPVYPQNDVHQTVFWDPQREKYVSHMRLWPYAEDLGIMDSRFEAGRQGRIRAVGIATSNDFKEWDAAGAIRHVPIEEISDYLLLAPDEQDAPRTRGLYTMKALLYEGYYIGFLSVYHNYPSWEYHPPPTRAYNGKAASPSIVDNIDIQLAFSRDGRAWQRAGNRETFIPNGPEGSYDSGMVFVSQSPVVREDFGEIWIYYVGYENRHSDLRYGRKQGSSVNLAILRLDGFVSLSAGRGSITTKPLVFEGNELVINANTYGDVGYVVVEILDADTGEPLEGFSQVDCEVFSGDDVDHVVRWDGEKGVGELEGKRVQLKFNLQSAKLFSFVFRHETHRS